MIRLIKVRITPLLKALGFRYLEGSSFIYNQEDKVYYEGRIYKRNSGERYVEIVKNHYDEFGDLHYRSLICKDLCLDIPDNQLGSIIIWIIYISKEIGNFEYVVRNINYWLGLENERYDINLTEEKPLYNNQNSLKKYNN